MKRPKCPKCRKPPARYTEFWVDHIIEFDADENGVADEEGILNQGDPAYVVAYCNCGHYWRLRGVLQISEVQRGYDDA